MLSPEENRLLTEVGPGTPGGELLRRYWHPVAPMAELTAEQPTRYVRLLGEDLVLFRDRQGRVGLLAEHCAHRGASLCYGRVEERGIACAYHGWLYDTAGRIVETPAERSAAIREHVRQRAYPVRAFVGLYWAYLGPLPAPEIPRYDVWARTDGWHSIEVYPVLDCNWLQTMENSVDPDHLQILHQEFFGRGRKPPSTTRGFIDERAEDDFYLTDYGIMKRRVYKNGKVDEHPLIFPNILRHGNETQIRVPIDDTHTWHVFVRFHPFEASKVEGDRMPPPGEVPVQYVAPFKDPPGALHPLARFRFPQVVAQDYMVWETQGPVADRTQEHLGHSDRGIVLLRRVLRENLERIARGEDPMGVVRDPNHPIIDTNLQQSLDSLRSAGVPAPR
jgi:5,5'-dehydrodivanillate O-demethylase